MAIRDRLTVVTKEGTCGLIVARQGGSIEVLEPNKNIPWLMAWVLDKNGNRTSERVAVPADQIVYFMQDIAPKDKPKK